MRGRLLGHFVSEKTRAKISAGNRGKQTIRLSCGNYLGG